MSNTITQTDFYQVPNLSFDINKLISDLEMTQKIKISNFRYYQFSRNTNEQSLWQR